MDSTFAVDHIARRLPRSCLSQGLLLLLPLLIMLTGNCQPAMAADAAARIVSFTGAVEIRRAGASAWEAGRHGLELYAGDIIRTGADARVAILLADETQMQLNRNSLLELKEVAQSSTWQRLRGYIKTGVENLRSSYNLESGEIWLRNKNLNANIDINTTVVSASIRGTELTVRIDAGDQAIITVLEGQILASNNLGNLTATAGEEVSATRGSAPVKRLLVQPEDAVQWVLVVPPLFRPEDLRIAGTPAAVMSAVDQVATLAEQGRYSEAGNALNGALRAHPGDRVLRTQAAWLDLLQGRPRAAQTALQAILNEQTELAPAW